VRDGEREEDRRINGKERKGGEGGPFAL